MTQATVTAKVHQTLDVHLNFTTQVTFNGEVRIDVLTDGQNFCVGQFVHAACALDAYSFADGFSRCVADTCDISECDRHPLVCRDVYAGNTCHVVFLFGCGSVFPEPFFTTNRPRLGARWAAADQVICHLSGRTYGKAILIEMATGTGI